MPTPTVKALMLVENSPLVEIRDAGTYRVASTTYLIPDDAAVLRYDVPSTLTSPFSELGTG